MSYLILVDRFNLLKSNGSSQLEQEASPLVEIDFQPSLVSRSTLSIKALKVTQILQTTPILIYNMSKHPFAPI